MKKTENRECKTHGLVVFRNVVSEGTHMRCTKCQSEAVSKRRRKLKLLAIEYMGGKCNICGYMSVPDVFDFHHKDPSAKDFAISTEGFTRSFEKLKIELDKCVMLCANCHREEHARLRNMAD